MVWKDRLYAFLLSRVLGPYLSPKSFEQLHESIEVSIQEGRFSLNNIELNAPYLSSKLSAVSIKYALIQKLQIQLSLREDDDQQKPESSSTSTSIAWRAMGLSRDAGRISLIAHLEIEGLDIHLGPCTTSNTTQPSTTSPTQNAEEATSSYASSMISSYVDAALASLRLSVEVKDVKCRLTNRQNDWVEVGLSFAKYQDQKASQASMHKAVNFLGIQIKCGSDEQQDLVAQTDGAGKITLRVNNMGSESRIQQNFDVALHHRFNVSVNERSLRRINSVVRSYSGERNDEEDENEQFFQQMKPEQLAAPLPPLGDDEEAMETMQGIMKQYAEARHLAEQKQVRGGILVPDSDSMGFDTFFDANDQSFSHYASVMESSILSQSKSDEEDYVHTQIKLHVGEFRLKVGFLAKSPNLPQEYMLMTFNDLNSSTQLSYQQKEFSISLCHLEMESSELASDNRPEITTLLSFEEDDDISNLVASAPSVDLTLKSTNDGSKSVDLRLQPIQFAYQERAISNLIDVLGAMASDGRTESTPPLTAETELSGSPSVSVWIPAISIVIPVKAPVEENLVRPLMARSGRMFLAETVRNEVLIGLKVEGISIVSFKDAVDTVNCVKCSGQKILLYVESPLKTARMRNLVQRVDLFCVSGQGPANVSFKKVVGSPMDETRKSIGERSFPKTPAISSFKARQEDDDDMDYVGNKRNKAETLRSPDPQPSMIKEAAKCSSVLEVVIPDLCVDLTKGEIEALFGMLLLLKPDKTTQEKPNNRASVGLVPVKAFNLCIEQTTFCVHDDTVENDGGSFKMQGSGWQFHAVLNGQDVKSARVMLHDCDLYYACNLAERVAKQNEIGDELSLRDRCDLIRQRTVRNESTVASPVLYRSRLFPSLSQESPALLLDFFRLDDCETTVHFSVYNVTHRADLYSNWVHTLTNLTKMHTAKGASRSDDNTDPQMNSVTKVFFTVADCNIDYTAPDQFTAASRSIFRFSDMRLSSNVVQPPGPVQSFRLSVGDISLLLGNRRHSYNAENSSLPRSVTILPPEALDLAAAPPDVHHMNLVTILTLDSCILAVNVAAQNSDRESIDPKTILQMTCGQLTLSGCKDSFQCFTETVGELTLKLTALTEQKIKELQELDKSIISMPKRQPRSELNAEEFFDTETGNIDEEVPDEAADLSASTIVPLNEGHFAITTQPKRDGKHAGPKDVKDSFELDGYDWTTVDHEWSRDDLPPGEDQVARWYDSSPTPLSNEAPSYNAKKEQALKIIPHHIEMKNHHSLLDGGDMDAGKHSGLTSSPPVNARVLLRDLRIRCRFFDGYDWPQYAPKRPKKARRPYAFVIDYTLDNDQQSKAQEQEAAKPAAKSKKQNLMSDLLGGSADNAADGSAFQSIPLPEERSIQIADRAERRRLFRRANRFLQISLKGLQARVDTFPDSDEHSLASCVHVHVQDFFVAETISNPDPTKMLGEWFSELDHPRDSKMGLLTLKMVTWHPTQRITDDGTIANDDAIAGLRILPLRCYIDQKAIRFARAFFTNAEETVEKRWAVGLREPPPPLFRDFKVQSCKLKVNYIPEKLDIDALRDGSIVELINLSPLNEMVIMLQKVTLEQKVGFGEAIGELLSSWIKDICATQLHKFVTNSSPFKPISSVSEGAVDMVVLPWEALRNGDKMSKALAKGVKSFAASLAYQALDVTSWLTSFASDKLSRATASGPKPSTRRQVPRGIMDTTGYAFNTVTKGLETANYKVIIVPYRQYQQTGPGSAIKSVVKGIPVAVLAPLGAASDALSYTLLGARNSVRPDIRKEEEANRRALMWDL